MVLIPSNIGHFFGFLTKQHYGKVAPQHIQPNGHEQLTHVLFISFLRCYAEQKYAEQILNWVKDQLETITLCYLNRSNENIRWVWNGEERKKAVKAEDVAKMCVWTSDETGKENSSSNKKGAHDFFPSARTREMKREKNTRKRVKHTTNRATATTTAFRQQKEVEKKSRRRRSRKKVSSENEIKTHTIDLAFDLTWHGSKSS